MQQRTVLWFLFAVVLVDMIGFGIVMRAGGKARYPRRARTRTPSRLTRTSIGRYFPSKFESAGW